MSTRALIAIRSDCGLFSAVYLHYDGYPDYTGRLLNKFHNTAVQAHHLCAGVEIRSLNEDTGEPERFSDGRRPWQVDGLDSLLRTALKCDCVYLYVFEDGHWAVHRVLSPA